MVRDPCAPMLAIYALGVADLQLHNFRGMVPCTWGRVSKQEGSALKKAYAKPMLAKASVVLQDVTALIITTAPPPVVEDGGPNPDL